MQIDNVPNIHHMVMRRIDLLPESRKNDAMWGFRLGMAIVSAMAHKKMIASEVVDLMLSRSRSHSVDVKGLLSAIEATEGIAIIGEFREELLAFVENTFVDGHGAEDFSQALYDMYTNLFWYYRVALISYADIHVDRALDDYCASVDQLMLARVQVNLLKDK